MTPYLPAIPLRFLRPAFALSSLSLRHHQLFAWVETRIDVEQLAQDRIEGFDEERVALFTAPTVSLCPQK